MCSQPLLKHCLLLLPSASLLSSPPPLSQIYCGETACLLQRGDVIFAETFHPRSIVFTYSDRLAWSQGREPLPGALQTQETSKPSLYERGRRSSSGNASIGKGKRGNSESSTGEEEWVVLSEPSSHSGQPHRENSKNDDHQANSEKGEDAKASKLAVWGDANIAQVSYRAFPALQPLSNVGSGGTAQVVITAETDWAKALSNGFLSGVSEVIQRGRKQYENVIKVFVPEALSPRPGGMAEAPSGHSGGEDGTGKAEVGGGGGNSNIRRGRTPSYSSGLASPNNEHVGSTEDLVWGALCKAATSDVVLGHIAHRHVSAVCRSAPEVQHAVAVLSQQLEAQREKQERQR